MDLTTRGRVLRRLRRGSGAVLAPSEDRGVAYWAGRHQPQAGDPSRGRSARRESSGARPWGPGKAPARSVTRHRGRKASVTPGTRQVPPASYRPQGSSRRPSGPEISDPPAGPATHLARARAHQRALAPISAQEVRRKILG